MVGHEVQSETLTMGHTSVSFMSYRFLQQIDELHFRVCIGDIIRNFNMLCDQVEPAEPTNPKIRRLILNFGRNREDVKHALRILAEVSWPQVALSSSMLRAHWSTNTTQRSPQTPSCFVLLSTPFATFYLKIPQSVGGKIVWWRSLMGWTGRNHRSVEPGRCCARMSCLSAKRLRSTGNCCRARLRSIA